jgi:predicted RNase H-like nuclease
VPLHVDSHDGWAELRREVVAAQRKSELRRAEDPVDAVVCAYVALYAQRRPAEITIYGDVATGCIVTPSLPRG